MFSPLLEEVLKDSEKRPVPAGVALILFNFSVRPGKLPQANCSERPRKRVFTKAQRICLPAESLGAGRAFEDP
jgi:hypothetical protein